jgi:ribosomal protein S18 acetylase RimI-like enzyme
MMEEIKIRAAQSEDAGRLMEFSLKLARETEGKELDPDTLTSGVAAILKDPSRGFFMIAEVAGEVAGSLMVTTEWSDWRNGEFWWIQSVYVSPEFRRRGVFRALYEETRGQARNSTRVCGCRLYVERENSSAQATYTQLGLTETPYRMYEELF